MAEQSEALLNASHRVNWVRLRTLIILRWIAIVGQLSAILLAPRIFDLSSINMGLAFFAIGASVTANLVAIFVYPENKRLTEGEMSMHLVFDILQLGFLLFLSGGLNNPFAVLMLVPVTVSATALQARTTLLIGTLSIALVGFLVSFHVPLQTTTGEIMRIPTEFLIGFWVAITIGIIFLSAFAQQVISEIHAMSDALAATQMALAREQKLTDLGGVIAAAAHELGTPLATMKLVSSELIEELGDRPDLREDAELISDQADRCRDILRSMGRAGKDDLHLKQVPVGELIREAAEPHADRGIRMNYDIAAQEGADPRQPTVSRRPEIIHGLRNLIQNAVDFAREDIWIECSWSASHVIIRIIDDGQGFPAGMIGRIGDPYVRGRQQFYAQRPEYEGMGLGLFIAKTL
ncbi:MAG: ActS/PrrB/RegB family redox-sensitive histidine kinase, partial [Pseudomonadota bacterium]